jgi:epoxide hydrolase
VVFAIGKIFGFYKTRRAMKYAIIFLSLMLNAKTSYSQSNKNAMKKVTEFKVNIPQSDLNDLKTRLQNTRWPASQGRGTWEVGPPVEYLKKLSEYWQNEYNWKTQENKLNQYPQFLTEIEGQVIHFIHVKSKHANAVPLLLIHGWPGSFADYLKVIDPLINPTNGKLPFHLVIPSIPGFGFSIPVKEKGWNMVKMASAFTELMKQLGYDKFGVHGEDMGAGITGLMSGISAQHLLGTHISTDFYSIAGLGMFPSDESPFSNEEKQVLNRMKEYNKKGTAYLQIQSTRPLTLGYGLTDSPVAQLAWIIEKMNEWTDRDKVLPEDAIAKDLLLTNVSLYWFNKSGLSSAETLYENMQMAFDWGAGASGEAQQWSAPKVKSAIAAFGKTDEASLLKKLASLTGNPDRWSFYEQGGHFPALEVPGILVNDLQEFFTESIKK